MNRTAAGHGCPPRHRPSEPQGEGRWNHWHGASPTTALTRIANQAARDGSGVQWMEHVSKEQCPAALESSGVNTR